MAIVYTKAKALLTAQATALAGEATSAGLTALASALTDLATEIGTNITSGTDSDFIGTTAGLFQIYTQELNSAAQIIRCRIENTVAGYTNTIQTKLTSIDTSTSGINTSTAGIKTDMDGIKTDLDSFKTDFDTMADNSTTIKNLATGTGIHMVGPYDWLGFASIYHLYVEQAKLTDHSGDASPEQQAAALVQLQSYLTKVRSLPTLF
jgi:hypothetical protein